VGALVLLEGLGVIADVVEVFADREAQLRFLGGPHAVRERALCACEPILVRNGHPLQAGEECPGSRLRGISLESGAIILLRLLEMPLDTHNPPEAAECCGITRLQPEGLVHAFSRLTEAGTHPESHAEAYHRGGICGVLFHRLLQCSFRRSELTPITEQSA